MLLAVLAVLAAAPQAAPATPAQTPAPAAAPVKGKEDVICKTEQETGSRFSKKVCYSKADYDERRRLEQQHLREKQTGGLQRQ